MSKKIRVGIIGGAGYTGGELIRILIHHPQAEIVFVNSKSNAGNSVAEVHTDLIGDTELQFSSEISNEIDVLFLCSGHGDSLKFLNANAIDAHVKIIDLSQDFRLKAHTTLGLRKFVYGLPEFNKTAIQTAQNIANPGCFATAIQLTLLPLAAANLLQDEIHVSGTTGSTGAGQSLSETSHFSWRNNNFSAYKMLNHQHLKEITESLKYLQNGFDKKINFIPYRGNFTRGILVTAYTKSNLSLDEANALYSNYYKEQPFVHISKVNPHLKQVVNTNKCVLYLEKHDDTLVIISMIDNLTKGASGQAVQNMNLLFGLDETTGLKLKTPGF
jgi:N-acetyl-gamma-glutamyl-phosphate reductase